jgi:serine phosphatase RsbU (regulator of sigma subunit)
MRKPGEIFNQARELVIENFAKSDEEVKDGMDASMCALDSMHRKLLWAGANNPIWIFRSADQAMEEIKADKQPIGKAHEPRPFTTHEITLNEGDVIYLFTDGYADQFGGENNKKLTRARFRELLLSIVHLPMEEQHKRLLAHHNQYRGVQEQVDDICVIGVRV